MSFILSGTSQKLPITLQTEAAECGLACLVMILSYYGHTIDLPSLRNNLAVSLKGMNLGQLIEAAERYSLAARPLRLELNEIINLQTPCILHWDMNHFVVLKRATAKYLEIHDPAKGFIKLNHKEITSRFTGVALELTPTSNFEIKNEKQHVRLRELFGHVLGLKRQLLLIFLISMGIELCGLLSPLYVQWVVDHALVSGDGDLVTLLSMGFFTVTLIQVCISSLRSWSILHLSTSISVQWSVNVFAHMIRLPLAWFEKRHLGDIISRFESIGSIQKTLTTSFIEAVIDGVMTIITLSMMIFYSAWMSLITLSAVILYALLRMLVYTPLRRATEEQIVLGAKQQSTFLESARGVQAIKLFGREGQRQIMWHNRVVDTANRLVATQKFMILYRLANGILLGFELILSVWLGAQLVLMNFFSIGMLFAFMTYKTVFAIRISSLIDKAIEVRMLSLQGERLADIVLTEKENLRTPQKRETLIKPNLTINNINFRYSALDPYILRNLSFEFPAGKSIAITGPSGCGKTTLAKLLLGLLKPESGHILADGQELERMGLHNYRPFVNAVMQDDQLFAGSIAENVAFFEQSIDMEKVESACRMACFHDDVQVMNMGYSTLIGDMGTALSGGQKQRLLLARALYRSPQILVLDEATSHLDVELEKAINQAIQNLSITRIVIAHRPQTIASCDCVFHLPSHNLV